MQIHVIESLGEIQELKPKWAELFDKTQPGLFSHHTWVYENFRIFNPDNIMLFAVYGDKKRLIGVFPFAINTFRIKWFHFKALTHGGSAVTDYSQFIIDPTANSQLMIKHVIAKLITLQSGRWDFFKIDNLSDGNDIANLFKNLMLRELYAGVTSTNVTPAIEYSRSHKQSKKIAEVKRKFNKIMSNRKIVHIKGEEINDDLLKKISKLHQISFPDSAFDTNQTQSFFKALIDDSYFNRYIHLSYIYYEEQIIAAHFGFMDSNTYYYYAPTYSEHFSKYGPGQYLLWELICLADDAQLVKFDFLRGAEDYKFDWINNINTNYTVLGITHNSSFLKKLLLNLWLITKEIPFFKQESRK